MLIGSLLGIFIFIVPFSVDGKLTITLAFLRDLISAPIRPALPVVLLLLLICSAIASLVMTVRKPDNVGAYVRTLFVVSTPTLIARVAAAVIAVMAYLKIGPPQMWNENTGGLIVYDLLPALLILFLLATILLPLLTEYGAMELLGGVSEPVFRPLFKLRGSTAILALSSWFGSGTVGMINIDDEYAKGRLTRQEGAILCFGFCTVTFPSIVIYSTTIAGLDGANFPLFFLTICLTCVVSTALLARMPPISRIPRDYFAGAALDEPQVTRARGRMKLAYDMACLKADAAPSPASMIKQGLRTAFRIYLDLFPLIVVLATAVLILSTYTPVFEIVSKPIVPLLMWAGIPDPTYVGTSLFIGFADLLLPFLTAANAQSQLAIFIICVVGTMQIICMSETGAVMLKSRMSIKFWQLAVIFLQKTLIALVIATVVGRLAGLT